MEQRLTDLVCSHFYSCGSSPATPPQNSHTTVEGSTQPALPTTDGATSLQGLVAAAPPQLGEDTVGRSEGCMAWMNALVGRIFWDFLREPYWAEQVSSKIQKKLSKIKVRGRSIEAPSIAPSLRPHGRCQTVVTIPLWFPSISSHTS